MKLAHRRSALSTTRPGFHLSGNYSPVPAESGNDRLRVSGYLPNELNGVYLRNGPNPRNGYSSHWFMGDGMVHGIRLANGKAEWYRSRYIDTEVLQTSRLKDLETASHLPVTTGKSAARLVEHGGQILALDENGWPIEIDRELNTIGFADFSGNLKTPIASHTKTCAVTGELFFISCGVAEPYLTLHRMAEGGNTIRSTPIELSAPTLIHDFALTDSHVLFFIYPLAYDPDLAKQRTVPYTWDHTLGSKLGMMPRQVDDRDGASSDIRWFDIPNGYVFHFMNAYEHPGDSISIHGVRYDSMWNGNSTVYNNDGFLTQWIVDLVDMRVAEIRKDDRPIEFPTIPPNLDGVRARYGYAAGAGRANNLLVKYDLDKDLTVAHDFGPDRFPGEAAFVKAEGAISEDDGFVMTLVYDRTTDTSDLVILDGRQVERRPLVTVHLEERVPFGFHGNWFDDEPKPRVKVNSARKRLVDRRLK